MQPKSLKSFFLLIIVCSATLFATEPVARPLTRSEVLALVAGGVLPENIVTAINNQGLAFKSDNDFAAQVKRAGADATVLAALKAGKVKAASGAVQTEKPEFIEQLTKAAELKRSENYSEAAKSLVTAMQSNPQDLSSAFVMAEVFRRQEDWFRARLVYGQIIEKDPDFPEAHTKLAYILYRLGDGEGAVGAARAALRRTTNNAEAHKNMGLGLDTLRKFDAAIVAYREALRIKPDYASVHYNLGILYYNKGDLENSVIEYKKAIALDPNNASQHHNLAVTYKKKGDLDGAIREYREAKRLAPDNFDARMGLANTLAKKDLDAAIVEFRELSQLAPDSVMCYVCFGRALLIKGDLQGATEQYRKAARLDPTNADARVGLGWVLLHREDYDGALTELLEAERLDPESVDAHRGLGMVFLAKKDFDRAIIQWKQVISLAPTKAGARTSLARALAGKGEYDAAIFQYQQELKLEPKNALLMKEIAGAFEKKGDHAGALEQYRHAAEAHPGPVTREDYKAAEQRLAARISEFKAAGRSAEAAKLETARRATGEAIKSSPQLEWQAAFDAGWKAFTESRLEDAEKSWKSAINLAEKLSARDPRLVRTITQLAWLYIRQKRFEPADASLRRAMAITEDGSVERAGVLGVMGQVSQLRNDVAGAASYYSLAVAIYEKHAGPHDALVGAYVSQLAAIYYNQRQFDKAEPHYLRYLAIEESRLGAENFQIVSAVEGLGSLYNTWRKFDKAEPYYRRVLALQEKQFGANSPTVGGTLLTLANLKRNMGAIEEAEKLDRRRETMGIKGAASTAAKP